MQKKFRQQAFADQIVAKLEKFWGESNSAKTDADAKHTKVIESYNGLLPANVRNAKTIQTKTHLCWTAKAVDAFTARLAPLLVPAPEDYFSLYDLSKRYSLSCSVMSKMMGYFFVNAELDNLIDSICDSLALEGALGLQPRWDYCRGTDKLPDLQINLINSADIAVYPVTEPIKRTILMTRTYMTKQELLDMAATDPSESFSQEAIDSLEQKELFQKPSVSGTPNYNQRLGLEVKDFYCPALKVDEQEFYHVRATVVAGKTLIRFTSKDDPGAYTSRGISFVRLNELFVAGIGNVRVGIGLCNKAYDLEMSAVTVHNLGIDGLKDRVKPPFTYDPKDPYYNKDRQGYAPGEGIPISSNHPRHLMDWIRNDRGVPNAEEMISRLMYQFEAAVAIPNFLSGTSDTDDRRVSATAKRIEANGADTGLRKHAQNINARGLRPMTIDVYEMIRAALLHELQQLNQMGTQAAQQGMQVTPEVINQLIARLPFLSQARAICEDFDDWLKSGEGIAPIEAVSLDLSTFEDALQKVDMVNSTERLLGNLLPVGQAAPELGQQLLAEFDLSALARGYANSLNLAETLKPPSHVAELNQQNQQAQQEAQQKEEALQQAQVQLEGGKIAAETQKLLADAEKTRAEVQKVQAETLQTLEETNNPKEPTSNGKPKPKKADG